MSEGNENDGIVVELRRRAVAHDRDYGGPRVGRDVRGVRETGRREGPVLRPPGQQLTGRLDSSGLGAGLAYSLTICCDLNFLPAAPARLSACNSLFSRVPSRHELRSTPPSDL